MEENAAEILTLDNAPKQVSKAILTKAKAFAPRDLDIEKKNRYMAYVDDGAESYDVMMILDGQNIKAHSCDCSEASGLCEHQVAMALFLKKHLKAEAAKAKEKAKPKKEKPKTEIETYLANASADALRGWILATLKNDKLLAMSFTQQFAPKSKGISKESIKQVLDSAYKILGRKRNFNAAEVKRLVDVLEPAIQPIMDQLAGNSHQKTTMALYYELFDGLFNLFYDYSFSGVRFMRLLERVSAAHLEAIAQEKDDAKQAQAFEILLKNILNSPDRDYYVMLQNYCLLQEGNFNPKQKDFNLKLLTSIYKLGAAVGKPKCSDVYLTHLLMEGVIEYDLYAKGFDQMPASPNSPRYTARLASYMIQQGDADKALKYLDDSIAAQTNKSTKKQFEDTYRNMKINVLIKQNKTEKVIAMAEDIFKSNKPRDLFELLKSGLSTADFNGFFEKIIAYYTTKRDKNSVRDMHLMNGDAAKALADITAGSIDFIIWHFQDLYVQDPMPLLHALDDAVLLTKTRTTYLDYQIESRIERYYNKALLQQYKAERTGKSSLIDKFIK
jgi:hypothetical protein